VWLEFCGRRLHFAKGKSHTRLTSVGATFFFFAGALALTAPGTVTETCFFEGSVSCLLEKSGRSIFVGLRVASCSELADSEFASLLLACSERLILRLKAHKPKRDRHINCTAAVDVQWKFTTADSDQGVIIIFEPLYSQSNQSRISKSIRQISLVAHRCIEPQADIRVCVLHTNSNWRCVYFPHLNFRHNRTQPELPFSLDYTHPRVGGILNEPVQNSISNWNIFLISNCRAFRASVWRYKVVGSSSKLRGEGLWVKWKNPIHEPGKLFKIDNLSLVFVRILSEDTYHLVCDWRPNRSSCTFES
jgi:hypothetical protein